MNKTLKGTIRPKVVLSGTISRTVEMIEPVIEPLEVTENGEYNVPEGVHGFNPVLVKGVVAEGHFVKTVNNIAPDENGNVDVISDLKIAELFSALQ